MKNRTMPNYWRTLTLIRLQEQLEETPYCPTTIPPTECPKLITHPGRFFYAQEITDLGFHLTTNERVLFYLSGKVQEYEQFEVLISGKSTSMILAKVELNRLSELALPIGSQRAKKITYALGHVIIDEYFGCTAKHSPALPEPQSADEAKALLMQAYICEAAPKEIDRLTRLAEYKFHLTSKEIWAALTAAANWLLRQN